MSVLYLSKVVNCYNKSILMLIVNIITLKTRVIQQFRKFCMTV